MKLKLIKEKKEAGDATSFLFEPEDKLKWQPGQYFFYTLPTESPDNRGVTRYFTISSAPSEEHIMISTRISENSSTFKKSLMNLKAGDEIEASGPDGQFVVDDPKRDLIFIAGGIGITPFRSILVENVLNNEKLNVQLLYANKDKHIVFKDELVSLKDRLNLKIDYFISPTHITENSINSEFSILNSQFFISGPNGFVREIRDMVKELGVRKENIKLDFFPGYSIF